MPSKCWAFNTKTMDTRHNFESGYQVAEAILNQYGFCKGVDKDGLLDMLWILDELEGLTHDKWIRKALEAVARDYEERFQGSTDREFLYRFARYLE